MSALFRDATDAAELAARSRGVVPAMTPQGWSATLRWLANMRFESDLEPALSVHTRFSEGVEIHVAAKDFPGWAAALQRWSEESWPVVEQPTGFGQYEARRKTIAARVRPNGTAHPYVVNVDVYSTIGLGAGVTS